MAGLTVSILGYVYLSRNIPLGKERLHLIEFIDLEPRLSNKYKYVIRLVKKWDTRFIRLRLIKWLPNVICYQNINFCLNQARGLCKQVYQGGDLWNGIVKNKDWLHFGSADLSWKSSNMLSTDSGTASVCLVEERIAPRSAGPWALPGSVCQSTLGIGKHLVPSPRMLDSFWCNYFPLVVLVWL